MPTKSRILSDEEDHTDKRKYTSRANVLKAQRTKAARQRKEKEKRIMEEAKEIKKRSKKKKAYIDEDVPEEKEYLESEDSSSEDEIVIKPRKSLKTQKRKPSIKRSPEIDNLTMELNRMREMINNISVKKEPKPRKPRTIKIVNQTPPAPAPVPIPTPAPEPEVTRAKALDLPPKPIVEELKQKILLNF